VKDVRRKSSEKTKTLYQAHIIGLHLGGIILPLSLGVKDPTYIAIFFGLVWILYVIIRWIAFLIRPELKIKVLRHKNPTIVTFELNDSGKKK
jgi:hypothetical protein